MKTITLLILNLSLLALFIFLLRKPGLLSYYFKGRWLLTWLSIAIITLMDELTSVFYAPAEAYRFIGVSAIFFIAFTAIFIHYMTTRLVEIAEILEHHKLIGGGVYSFSYLVLGPMVSFVAVASIMVDYTLTACLSAVSAVLNASSFFPLSQSAIIALVLVIIWGVAGLNILGIRDNARFTFSIFIMAAFIFLNLIVSGIIGLDGDSIARLKEAVHQTHARLQTGSWIGTYEIFIASVASCVLAYSGVESVLQTAGLVRNWQETKKAYIFLAITVGLVTPVIAALALSANIDFAKHEGDLITYFGTLVNGVPFGMAVGALASFTLTMAVNTAFVASSELMERAAHRYGFLWLIATNRRQSLYRIHLLNAIFFSAIIFITQGRQMILADMYALGLIACFCINMGSLLIYRYFRGTKEVIHFNTSRLVTLVMWVVFVSCFVFLANKKPHGLILWATVTGMVLLGGFIIARKRAPEIKEIEKTDSEMEMILQLAQSSRPDLHIYFRRPWEEALSNPKDNEAYITFYSPRQGIPSKAASNHYRFPLIKTGLYQRMVAILKVVEYEMPESRIIVHFGWPMSSWLDRLSIGVMVFNLMRLPRIFPKFQFVINYLPRMNPS
ncbi:MAG: amino acid permease [Thermodesulfobacteriota bacterium]|jgi:amino acid transporter|nr:MAG: amino acid permease [Thermodesulfobacteriota bacterium]